MELFKALSDENRLRILHLLSIRPFCVCEIEVLLNLSQSNVSRHLSKLKSVNLITASKDAQWVHYELSPEFEKSHDKLLGYLRDLWQSQPSFVNDATTYKKYDEAELSCKDIAERKQVVIQTITI